jgi:hypothetical protein
VLQKRRAAPMAWGMNRWIQFAGTTAALAAAAGPCGAESQIVSAAGPGALVAQAHIDFRIVVQPSLALRLDGRSAQVTSTQNAPLHWQAGTAGTPDELWQTGRRGLNRVVPVEAAPADAGPPRFITLAAP